MNAQDASGSGAGAQIPIFLDQDWEVRFWTKKLGCTADELPEKMKALRADFEELMVSADINAERKWERDYWCTKLGCAEKELYGAIESVGTGAEHVRDFIGGLR